MSMYLEDSKSKSSFSFLNDADFEEELYLSYAYIRYLTEVLDSGTLSKFQYIEYSIAHNIAIYFWWILEALLHKYMLLYFEKIWDEKAVKKFCKIITYKELTEIIPTLKDPNIGIVYCERNVKTESYKDNINFSYLIKWCRDKKLFSTSTLNSLDKIREIRNWVHLTTIMEVKNIYSYKDLRNITEDVRKIFSELKEAYIKL